MLGWGRSMKPGPFAQFGKRFKIPFFGTKETGNVDSQVFAGRRLPLGGDKTRQSGCLHIECRRRSAAKPSVLGAD